MGVLASRGLALLPPVRDAAGSTAFSRNYPQTNCRAASPGPHKCIADRDGDVWLRCDQQSSVVCTVSWECANVWLRVWSSRVPRGARDVNMPCAHGCVAGANERELVGQEPQRAGWLVSNIIAD